MELDRKLKRYCFTFTQCFKVRLWKDMGFRLIIRSTIEASYKTQSALEDLYRYLYSPEDEKGLQRILIEAAYDVFTHYEYQFSKVPSERIEEMGIEAAEKSCNYLKCKANEDMTNLLSDIVKGIISGVSAKSSRTPQEKSITPVDFFSKPVIWIQENNITYYGDKMSSDYRLLFPWEDKLSIVATRKLNQSKKMYEYQYIKKNKKQQLELIHEFICAVEEILTHSLNKQTNDNIPTEQRELETRLLNKMQVLIEKIETSSASMTEKALKKKFKNLSKAAKKYLAMQNESFNSYMSKITNSKLNPSIIEGITKSLAVEHMQKENIMNQIITCCQNDSVTQKNVPLLLDTIKKAIYLLGRQQDSFYRCKLQVQVEIKSIQEPVIFLDMLVPKSNTLEDIAMHSTPDDCNYNVIKFMSNAEKLLIQEINHIQFDHLIQYLNDGNNLREVENLEKQLKYFKDGNTDNLMNNILNCAHVQIQNVLSQYNKMQKDSSKLQDCPQKHLDEEDGDKIQRNSIEEEIDENEDEMQLVLAESAYNCSKEDEKLVSEMLLKWDDQLKILNDSTVTNFIRDLVMDLLNIEKLIIDSKPNSDKNSKLQQLLTQTKTETTLAIDEYLKKKINSLQIKK